MGQIASIIQLGGGIPWSDVSPLDKAYENPNGAITDSSAGAMGGGAGFNLPQWFKDQGITNPTKQTYYEYTQIRNIPYNPSAVTIQDSSSHGAVLDASDYFTPNNYYQAALNPYQYQYSGGVGLDNFTMAAQNKALTGGLNLNLLEGAQGVASTIGNGQQAAQQAAGTPHGGLPTGSSATVANPLGSQLALGTQNQLSGGNS